MPRLARRLYGLYDNSFLYKSQVPPWGQYDILGPVLTFLEFAMSLFYRHPWIPAAFAAAIVMSAMTAAFVNKVDLRSVFATAESQRTTTTGQAH